MAVLSVAPWKTYRDALQPQFSLTAESALQQVLPNTADYEEKILNAFALRVKAGLPGTSSSSTTSTHQETGIAAVTKSDAISTSSSGDVSKIDFASAPTSAAAGGLPGSTLANALGFAPMMKYWAALALFQEVQLINRYLKDAAINDNFVPYIVRLQMTFLPRTRAEAYDVYSSISFFAGDFPAHFVYSDKDDRKFKPGSAECLQCGLGKIGNDWTGASSTNDVRIIPLLVTDDIETAMESRSVERIQHFALALQALIHGVGAGVDIQNIHDKLQTVLSRDYNSQFTVARASDNTLRVRFGAAQQASTRYAAIPQTHNVTLLVLAPKRIAYPSKDNSRLIHLVSKVSMVNALTGKELPTKGHLDQRAREVLVRNGFTRSLDKEQISLLNRCIFANDYASFVQLIGEPGKGLGGMHFRDALWADLATLHGLNEHQTATLQLPALRPPTISMRTQTPILMDDKAAGMTATIAGAADVDPKEVTAIISGKIGTSANDARTVEFPASAIAYNEATRQLVLTFPSVTNLGKEFFEQPQIQLTRPADPLDDPAITAYTGPDLGKYACIYIVKTPSPSPKFEVSAAASAIVANGQGHGRLQIRLGGVETTSNGVTITIKGADNTVTDLSPAGIRAVDAANPGKLIINKNGLVTLELFNLTPTEKVVITAKDEKARLSLPDITLPVFSSGAKGEDSSAAQKGG